MKQLSVRLHGSPVGILQQTSSGKLQFSYKEDVTQSISVNIPISAELYGNNTCEAFFGGLLPENESVRKIIAKYYGVSPTTFGLLKAIGHDCAGAISFHEINEPVNPQKLFSLSD